MRIFRSWIDPGSPWLTRYLRRLRETLEDLLDRMREAIARALGENAAGAVHEAIRALLADVPGHPAVPYRPARESAPAGSVCDDPEESAIWEDEDPHGSPDDEDEEPTLTSPRGSKAPPDWSEALTVGLQTTTWWLRRRVGRYPVLTALGVGLATALATCVGGPVAAAVVGLAGSALGLMSLATTVQCGAETLAALSP